jgi:hypothetical protein
VKMSGAGYASIDAVQPEEDTSLERLMFSLGARAKYSVSGNKMTPPSL